MRAFHALDWVTVTGRGPMAQIAAAEVPLDLFDPTHLTGEEVLIDDELYLVTAVETFAIPRGPEKPYRLSFGLLVADAV